MTRYQIVKEIIEGLEPHWRRYCNAKECACLGCVNIRGISKEEFEKWKKGELK
jgi:hypothetical protein